MLVSDHSLALHNSVAAPSNVTHAKPLKVLPLKALLLAPIALAGRALGQPVASLRGASTQSFDPRAFGERQLQAGQSGKLSCPCIPLNQTQLASSNNYDKENGCFYLQQPKGTYCYPLNYGLEGCQAYDENLTPYCDKEGFPGNPDWCEKSFCYVDKDNCQGFDFYPSSYFSGEGLYYSYATCGETNTFIDMLNDISSGSDVRHSFMELVATTEREVVSIKQSVEEHIDEIKAFSNNPDNVAKVCTYSDSCTDPVLEGVENACWGTKVDFYGVNVLFPEQNRRRTNPQDLNVLSCLTRDLEATMLNAADSQHDDKNRTAYIYYGDQNTGALVAYPELEVCSSNFDARFRPWYASAVSGPKDVIAVIDVSGSMVGNRIDLAKQATDAVINTLTWADRVTLVTFNEGIASVYSQDLVQANEENIDKMSQWITDNFRAEGGTNFMKPLETAYDILARNKDANDQKTCSQAILFLTDGDAPFDKERMAELASANPDAVIFSYGLGGDAKKSALQDMACMTNGLFHPVNSEGSLSTMMSSYYEYYAGLQDSSNISWIQYQDAFSGSEMVAACVAIKDYDQKGMMQPDLVGVACMDLNTIVDPETLKSCQNNGYKRFIDQIFREATRCPSKGSIIKDDCTLQQMRAKISRDSVCVDQASPASCVLPVQPNASDYSRLDPARFQYIPLEGCVKQNLTCVAPAKPKPFGPGSSSGVNMAIIGGAAAAGLAGILLGIYCCYRRQNRIYEHSDLQSQGNQTPQQTHYPVQEMPVIHPVAPSAPLEEEIRVQPSAPYGQNTSPYAPAVATTYLQPIPAPRTQGARY